MKTYIISYDMAEGGDYQKLIDEIKSYGTWAHITESTWAIEANNEVTDVRDHLKNYLPKGSSLFVVKSGVEAAWINVLCSNKWLKENL